MMTDEDEIDTRDDEVEVYEANPTEEGLDDFNVKTRRDVCTSCLQLPGSKEGERTHAHHDGRGQN